MPSARAATTPLQIACIRSSTITGLERDHERVHDHGTPFTRTFTVQNAPATEKPPPPFVSIGAIDQRRCAVSFVRRAALCASQRS